MSDYSTRKITVSVNSIMDKLLAYARKQVVKVGGVSLYPVEAHMLVAGTEGMNFTEVARHFGVTKGAVSQAMSRLARKGLVVVEKDRLASNAARVEPTELGRAALARIREIRERLQPAVDQLLSGLDDDRRHTIAEFVTGLETLVDGYLNALGWS